MNKKLIPSSHCTVRKNSSPQVMMWVLQPEYGRSQDLYECLNMDRISKFYTDMGQTFLWCSSKQTALHLKLMSLNQPYVSLLLHFLLLRNGTTGDSTWIFAHLCQVQPPNLFVSFQSLAGNCSLPNISQYVAPTRLSEFHSDYPVFFSYLSCLFTCWYTWRRKGEEYLQINLGVTCHSVSQNHQTPENFPYTNSCVSVRCRRTLGENHFIYTYICMCEYLYK